MIIICPCGEKKFEIDSNLIPEKGRTLQCGACDRKWFYKNTYIEETVEKPIELPQTQDEVDVEIKKSLKTNLHNNSQKKQIEDINYNNGINLNLSKIFSYFIVLIITSIAAIIFLDTFKNNLSSIFPNLELFLFNLFETIKDINLFIKDLIR